MTGDMSRAEFLKLVKEGVIGVGGMAVGIGNGPGTAVERGKTPEPGRLIERTYIIHGEQGLTRLRMEEELDLDRRIRIRVKDGFIEGNQKLSATDLSGEKGGLTIDGHRDEKLIRAVLDYFKDMNIRGGRQLDDVEISCRRSDDPNMSEQGRDLSISFPWKINPDDGTVRTSLIAVGIIRDTENTPELETLPFLIVSTPRQLGSYNSENEVPVFSAGGKGD